jgi:hypothetical protein
MNRLGEFNHTDLSLLFSQNKKAKEKELYTPFNIFKAATTHSSISKYAIVGGMLGWYSGQSFELGLVGAAVGGVKDLIPILYHELPEDIKELASNTANIGLATLGTYAIYNSIPDMWVANIFSAVPNCIKNFPEAYHNFWNSPISTPDNPRTLEAAAKATMQFLSPIVTGGTAAMTLGLNGLGFGQIRKFSVSFISSNVILKVLNHIGEYEAIRPFTKIIKDFSKDRSKFISKVVDVAAAISAIPVAAYLKSSPIQPISLVKPDVSLSFYKRAIATLTYIGGSIVNSAISPEFYARALIVGAFAIAHIECNLKKPPEAKKELPEFEKITLEDVYDLLLIGLQGTRAEKDKQPMIFERVNKLQAELEPIRNKLDRAVRENHIEMQTEHRNAILNKIDAEIQKIAILLNPVYPDPPLEDKDLALYQMICLELLDLKLEELSYQDNDRAHRGVPGQRARMREQIRDALDNKFTLLTELYTYTNEQFDQSKVTPNTKKTKALAKLRDSLEKHRERTHDAIVDL